MEIDKTRTTAYRAHTNGMVERFHRTLNAILGKIISENQRDCCEKVPIATAAYRYRYMRPPAIHRTGLR